MGLAVVFEVVTVDESLATSFSLTGEGSQLTVNSLMFPEVTTGGEYLPTG